MISILIPSKNEPHLQRTIDDIYEHAETDLQVLHAEDTGMGQRALTRQLAELSSGKYVMKADAHCSFSQGFDTNLLKHFKDDMIMAPRLLNLEEETWTPHATPISSAYCFDTDLVFQYNVPAENTEMVNETMCLQGSAWMVTKENYFKWSLDDPAIGSWGHQGVELGVKAYLNGGRCVTNKDCHYAHLFRHTEKEFPYKRDKKQIQATSQKFRKMFLNKKIAGLIEKYDYPSNWTKEDVDSLS